MTDLNSVIICQIFWMVMFHFQDVKYLRVSVSSSKLYAYY